MALFLFENVEESNLIEVWFIQSNPSSLTGLIKFRVSSKENPHSPYWKGVIQDQ